MQGGNALWGIMVNILPTKAVGRPALPLPCPTCPRFLPIRVPFLPPCFLAIRPPFRLRAPSRRSALVWATSDTCGVVKVTWSLLALCLPTRLSASLVSTASTTKHTKSKSKLLTTNAKSISKLNRSSWMAIITDNWAPTRSLELSTPV